MRVGLFITCLVDLMRPRIGFAALKLLRATGAEVHVPRTQTCCGQPAYNSGDREGARELAQKFAREFQGCDYVVSPSGSCAGMIHTHYPGLIRGDSELVNAVSQLASHAYELTDFLTRVAKIDRVPGEFQGTVTYHDSCSGLRELGIRDQPRALLSKLPGLRLVEMNESTTCCGFGGTFSVKFGDISARMADNKCNHIAATGADAIVAGDLGCLLNIEGRLRRRGDEKTKVLHVAEVLAGTDEDEPCR
jgi:L-lactate dehydrogenase complex protein LldE